MKEQVEAVKTKLNTVFQKMMPLKKRMDKLEAGGVRNGTGSKPKIQGEYTRKPNFFLYVRNQPVAPTPRM